MGQSNRLPEFRNRLTQLMGKESNTGFAKFLGLTRQTLGFYLNGDRIPDAETLRKICIQCNVSADWLLGLSEAKTPSVEEQAICKYTGLHERVVQYLHELLLLSECPPENKGYSRIDMISELLSAKNFDFFLALCTRYVELGTQAYDLKYSASSEYIAFSDALIAHGYAVTPASDFATVLFSERIVNLLRGLLNDITDKHFDADVEKAQGERTDG